MTTHAHRAVRFFFVIFLLLSLSAVYSSSAQSTALTQIAKTLDGEISIRLPAGWQSRDTAASIFTSVLAVGDNAQSLQSVIDSLTSTPNSTTATMNGIIGIVNPQFVGGLSTDLAISTLLNSLISGVQQQGGQILEQQSILLGGQYPASIALVSVSAEQAKGYIGVFQAGANIGEFTMGATPERSFDANQQMFIDMMNSIRMPAETGSSLPPTAAVATAVPVNPLPSGDGTATASATGIFSVQLPTGWVNQPFSLTGFSDLVAFGSSQTNMQTIIGVFANGQEIDTFDGIGGFAGTLDVAQLGGRAPGTLVSQLMQEIITSIGNESVQIVEPPAAHTFGGQYAGELALTSLGFIAAMHSDQQLLVSVILTDKVDANRAIMSGVLESVRMPAEAGQPPPVTLPTVAAPPPVTELETVRSSDDHVSLVIPSGWTLLDHAADQNILAYGDTDAAAQSRLASAQPDLAPATDMTGNGGLIILYTMDRFGIDPKNPDLNPLMERALGGLSGYTIEQAAQPLDGGGLYAVIAGTERGYLALIPFGDQIAYVTATGTPASFEANADTLLAIVQSVRVPAQTESPGLGGLGGLGSESVTPEATAPGLGGL